MVVCLDFLTSGHQKVEIYEGNDKPVLLIAG